MSLSFHPQEPSQLAPGDRLDRYELLCPIGAGGMASVWVARLLGKHGFEKLVAIKTILPRYARDPKFHAMFLEEARIASLIQHVNVAQILDLGDQDGVMFLAMEWVEGEALSKLAHSVHEAEGLQFPPGIALRVLSDVCAGLHAAHELRDRSGASLDIVHRDVSPHNILISDQGIAKIIDFGIAKARDRVGGDTETGSFKGKVRYVAPEQALSPRSTDRRADIWAVGAVLYYLMAGRSPYAGDNDIATLTHLASGRPPLPLPPGVPREVRAVVNRALAWHPQDRPPTAAELGRGLENAIAHMGITVTSADVAAFCREHFAARMDARRSAIASALSVVNDRARALELVGHTSGSGSLAIPRTSAGDSGPPTIAGGLAAAGTMTSGPVLSSTTGKRWRIAGALAAAFAVVVAGAVSLGRVKEQRSSGAAAAAVASEAPSVSATATIASAAPPLADPAVGASVVAQSQPPPPPNPSPSDHPSRRPPVTRPPVSASSPPTATTKQRRQYGF